MPDSLCRLTVAACSDDAHCAVDLALPADMYIGQLMPQIVDLVHRDTVLPVSGRHWRLSRLGDPPTGRVDDAERQQYSRWRRVIAHDHRTFGARMGRLRSEPCHGSRWYCRRRADPADCSGDLLRAPRRTRCGDPRVVGIACRVGDPHRHRHMPCRRCDGGRSHASAPPPERPAESGRRVLRRRSRIPGGTAGPTRNRSAASIRRRVLCCDPHTAPDWLRPNIFDGDCDRERADRDRRCHRSDVEAAAERGRRDTCPRSRWRFWESRPGCRWRSAASARRHRISTTRTMRCLRPSPPRRDSLTGH